MLYLKKDRLNTILNLKDMKEKVYKDVLLKKMNELRTYLPVAIQENQIEMKFRELDFLYNSLFEDDYPYTLKSPKDLTTSALFYEPISGNYVTLFEPRNSLYRITVTWNGKQLVLNTLDVKDEDLSVEDINLCIKAIDDFVDKLNFIHKFSSTTAVDIYEKELRDYIDNNSKFEFDPQ